MDKKQNTLKIPETSIRNFELSDDAKQLLDILIPPQPQSPITNDTTRRPDNT